MKLAPSKLIPAQYTCYYLYGEDRDALFESAEALLACPEGKAQTIRADIGEIERIELESKHQGLFGTVRCHALIRNAESASPKQTEQLLQLVDHLPEETRLVICAAGIEARKALHRKMMTLTQVASCHFPRPTSAKFREWLLACLADEGLKLSKGAEVLLAEHLDGMRLAAQQAIERLRLYDGGKGEELGTDVVGDLVGEHSPDELADYCRAMAMREGRAISLLHRLLHEQHVAEVLILSWLQTRFQGLLLYLWHAQGNSGDAVRRAGLFKENRKLVPQEARHWQPLPLMRALALISEAEVKLKGASIESKPIVMERLALQLLALDTPAP